MGRTNNDQSVPTTDTDAEAAAKAEAEAMAAAEAEAAAAPAPALTFDTSETGMTGAMLAEWARNPGAPNMAIIFGGGGQSVAGVPVFEVSPRDFAVEGKQIVFAGKITLIGEAPLAGGVEIDSVALADSGNGPVRSVCEISGKVSFAEGQEFSFGPGAFLFR